MRRAGLWVPVSLSLGMLLMQLAWILAVPPFAAIDEFAHAYRAEAVAHGQWMPPYAISAHGQGGLVAVPRSIVTAAGPECSVLSYTGSADCSPVRDLGHGMVEVASSASLYNPLFYWMIGTPAKVFDGNGAKALYSMRVVAAVLCSALVGLAGWVTTRWARTRWPLTGLMVALTPVAIYSTSVAAPNGIEMCAALSLWVALLGLSRDGLPLRTERALLYACIPGGIVLATVRYLGPLWLGLTLITVIALAGRRRIRNIWQRSRRQMVIAAGGVLTAAAANGWWVLANNVLGREPGHVPFPDPVRNSARQLPLWIFQGIAAYPYRNQPAPIVVYAAVGLVIAMLVGWGTVRARVRLRWTILLNFTLSLSVPLALAILEYPALGNYWQGRYGLPYTFGLMLLAGLALESTGSKHRMVAPLTLGCWLALVVGHTSGVVHVLDLEMAGSPSFGSPTWLMPQPWMVGVLMVAGWLVWGMLCRATPKNDTIMDVTCRTVDLGAGTETARISASSSVTTTPPAE